MKKTTQYFHCMLHGQIPEDCTAGCPQQPVPHPPIVSSRAAVKTNNTKSNSSVFVSPTFAKRQFASICFVHKQQFRHIEMQQNKTKTVFETATCHMSIAPIEKNVVQATQFQINPIGASQNHETESHRDWIFVQRTTWPLAFNLCLHGGLGWWFGSLGIHQCLNLYSLTESGCAMLEPSHFHLWFLCEPVCLLWF